MENTGHIQAEKLTKRFRKVQAVRGVDLDIAPAEIYGLIGPDGAGKTTTIRMLAGVMKPTSGVARVSGFDTAREAEQLRLQVGYMAQRFSLYGDLSVRENIEFYADIFGVRGPEREQRILRLLRFARLEEFQGRAAGVLSGGMKKKLGLACALIHRPKVLFLDEPTNGVDPISRREFWDILSDLHIDGVTIFISTAYMDEAERCSRVGLMYQGEIIRQGSPQSLRQLVKGDLLAIVASDLPTAETAITKMAGVYEVQVYGDRLHVFVDDAPKRQLEITTALQAQGVQVNQIRPAAPHLQEAFISLVTQQTTEHRQQTADKESSVIARRVSAAAIPEAIWGLLRPFGARNDKSKQVMSVNQPGVIVTEKLTRKFGKFVAVDHISFQVSRGEIFGFLGPNGSGKTTTIRMLLGLLHPTSGTASVLGYDVVHHADSVKRSVGYMSQKFSLYNDLTVIENLNFYGRAYDVWGKQLVERQREALELAELVGYERTLTANLAGGFKQRLALATAIIHKPPIVFLDEPTAGVDPVVRRDFWRLLYRLAAEGTTIFVTTHYMDEAEQCHRLAFIYNGKIVATGTPNDIKENQMHGQVIEIDCDPPGRALETLRQLENLEEVALYGSLVHIVVHDLEKQRAEIQSALNAAQVTINSMIVIPPSLEDVFIARARG